MELNILNNLLKKYVITSIFDKKMKSCWLLQNNKLWAAIYIITAYTSFNGSPKLPSAPGLKIFKAGSCQTRTDIDFSSLLTGSSSYYFRHVARSLSPDARWNYLSNTSSAWHAFLTKLDGEAANIIYLFLFWCCRAGRKISRG